MFELIAALIGVGLATVGVFLFFSNRFTGHRRLGGELLSVALLLGGGAILLSALALNFDGGKFVPEFDPNALLEQQPPAAGRPSGGLADTPTASKALLPYKNIVVLSWGTPSDMDAADNEHVEAYSLRLADMASALLEDYSRDAQVRSYSLTRQDFDVLKKSPLASTGWCKRYQADLLVAIGMGTVQANNGDYALWREPVYEALDCRTEQASRRIGKINERAGDSFPYQLAARTDLANLLDEFTVAE